MSKRMTKCLFCMDYISCTRHEYKEECFTCGKADIEYPCENCTNAKKSDFCMCENWKAWFFGGNGWSEACRPFRELKEIKEKKENEKV